MTINFWAKHYQSAWRERAVNPAAPNWFRIGAFAFGCHRGNGHANFKPGELRELLGTFNADGVLVPVHATEVSRAIAQAKVMGLIDNSSCSRCLVVRPHEVNGGEGSPNERCSYHDGRRTGQPPRLHTPKTRRIREMEAVA